MDAVNLRHGSLFAKPVDWRLLRLIKPTGGEDCSHFKETMEHEISQFVTRGFTNSFLALNG
jgi:hypothetical protein